MMLKTLTWLPAMVSDGCDQFVKRLEIGSKLFVKSPDVLQLLAGHVSYLSPVPLPTSTLATFLGIQRTITVDFTSGLLKSWCDRQRNPSVAVTFRTSLQHMRAVYEFLDRYMTKHQLEELLHSHPVIFYTCCTVSASSIVEGKFLYWSEVVWADETGLFEKYRESLLNADPTTSKLYRYPLSAVYPDMKEFFTRTVRVVRSPGIAELVQLLIYISTTCVVSKVLPDVLYIFSVIGRSLLANGETGDVLRSAVDQLKTEKVIPGKNGSWLGLDCHPMIADDRNLEKMFTADAAVFFVDCGEKIGVGNVRMKASHKGLENFAIKLISFRELYLTVNEVYFLPLLSICSSMGSLSVTWATVLNHPPDGTTLMQPLLHYCSHLLILSHVYQCEIKYGKYF